MHYPEDIWQPHPALQWPKEVPILQVPILDPQIHIMNGYEAYDQGIAQGVFLKDMTGQPYNGQASYFT